MLSNGIRASFPNDLFKINKLSVTLLLLGAVLHAASYQSSAPVMAALIFLLTAQLLLALTALGGVAEQRIFNRVFGVGYVMSGIAAVYANQFQDASQLDSDAAVFFELATAQIHSQLSFVELQTVSEGALAIVIWGTVYDLFAALGFSRERYIGILVNVTAVALSGVVALKMSRLTFGQDPERFKRLTKLFAGCGLFWLFAGIHLRDSVVLLSMTGLAYGWLSFLAKPDLSRRLIQITVLSLVSAVFLGFLRREFFFAPIAMAMAATAALTFGQGKRRNRLVVQLLVVVGLVVGAGLLLNFREAIEYALFSGRQSYSELASDQHAADSLGMALIGNQAMPIRLILGSAYLYLFPIPFWTGFQMESAYSLFKSFNVIFFYFLLPLLMLAAIRLWASKTERTPSALFLLFTSTGFTLAVAGTSLETRHFGAFLSLILVLALLPDLRTRSTLNSYRQLLIVTLTGVALIHLTWFLLKL